jgi:hypothetical protein
LIGWLAGHAQGVCGATPGRDPVASPGIDAIVTTTSATPADPVTRHRRDGHWHLPIGTDI